MMDWSGGCAFFNDIVPFLVDVCVCLLLASTIVQPDPKKKRNLQHFGKDGNNKHVEPVITRESGYIVRDGAVHAKLMGKLRHIETVSRLQINKMIFF